MVVGWWVVGKWRGCVALVRGEVMRLGATPRSERGGGRNEALGDGKEISQGLKSRLLIQRTCYGPTTKIYGNIMDTRVRARKWATR